MLFVTKPFRLTFLCIGMGLKSFSQPNLYEATSLGLGFESVLVVLSVFLCQIKWLLGFTQKIKVKPKKQEEVLTSSEV